MFQIAETGRNDIGRGLIQGHEEKLLDEVKLRDPIWLVHEVNI